MGHHEAEHNGDPLGSMSCCGVVMVVVVVVVVMAVMWVAVLVKLLVGCGMNIGGGDSGGDHAMVVVAVLLMLYYPSGCSVVALLIGALPTPCHPPTPTYPIPLLG